jgi:hypothetical protein
MDQILKFPGKFQGNDKIITEEESFEIEFFLKDHIELNLFQTRSSMKIDDHYFNENLVKHTTEKHNYEYSILCLRNLFKIMKRLELQNISCKHLDSGDESKFLGIVSEKRKKMFMNKHNKGFNSPPYRNIVDYFIQSHLQNITRELYNNESNLNNYEIENKICLSLFMLKKLIKDYSFYFEKKPELERIFLELKKFKDWPLPIGHLSMSLFDTLINELYFQGFTIMDQIRKLFFLDIVDAKDNLIDTKLFNSVYIISGEDQMDKDKEYEVLMNYLTASYKSKPFNMREFLVKMFITIVRNTDLKYSISSLDTIVRKFMIEKKVDRIQVIDFNNDEDAKSKSEDVKYVQQDDSTKNCINTLFKIIYVGLDKTYDDFVQDLHILAQPLINIEYGGNITSDTNITRNPITEMRNKLKPKYIECDRLVVPIFDNCDMVIPEHQVSFNLYESYKNHFKNLYENHFSYLDDIEIDDEAKRAEYAKKRSNLYRDFKMKYVLIEDKKIFSSFISQLYNRHRKLDKNEGEILEDRSAFWYKFIGEKEILDMNYILYILPKYENIKDIHPLYNKDTKNNVIPLVSEYISSQDYIYQTVVYNTWMNQRELEFTQYIENLNLINNYKEDSCNP